VSARVPTAEEFVALAARVAELEARLTTAAMQSESLYLTIPEAAKYLGSSRQRVDDLLSQRRLQRVKDGARTLIRRSDLVAYLEGGNQPAGTNLGDGKRRENRGQRR
jgi:excisionase family DNA binding protein